MLATLCATVLISYGVVYYAFTVLAPRIAADTGWGLTAVTAAFSVGSVTGALAGVPVGRMIQRHGPRWVMTLGSVLASAAIAAVATAPSYPVFLAAWILAGLSTTGVYYAPAFAALTQWYGDRSIQAITALTLVAGFSSTVFAPLTDALAARLEWRGTYLVLAALLLVSTAPAHAAVLRLPWPTADRAPSARRAARALDREIATSRTFVLLTTAATLTSLVVYAALINLVPLLIERGLSSAIAAWALGIGGVGQVAGRLFYPALARRLGPQTRMAAVVVTLAVTLVAFAHVPGTAALVVLVALGHGAAKGLFTLVGATLVSDLWGPSRYAALNGVYHAPVSAAAALAPALGAAAASLIGFPALFTALAVLALVAAGLTLAAPTPTE